MHLLRNVKANQLMQRVLVDKRPQQTIKYWNSFTHNRKWTHGFISTLVPESICDLCGSNRKVVTRLVSFENYGLSTRVICSCRFCPSHNSRWCSKCYRVCRGLWTTKYHWCDGINFNDCKNTSRNKTSQCDELQLAFFIFHFASMDRQNYSTITDAFFSFHFAFCISLPHADVHQHQQYERWNYNLDKTHGKVLISILYTMIFICH